MIVDSLFRGYRPVGGNGGRREIVRLLVTPKLIVSAVCAFLLITLIFNYDSIVPGKYLSETSSHNSTSAAKNKSHTVHDTTPKARFHLLIPATQSNAELCKLITSAQILDYPTPVLINWGMQPGKDDDSNTHLAKLSGFVDYLDGLLNTNSTYEEELILILDGYDIWLQLRRDIMIQRYYDLVRDQNAFRVKEFGKELFYEHDMREAIFFGHDKVCWPMNNARPACWAAPRADLADDIFGPETNRKGMAENHPRWLNSGTIIGPAKDLRDFFKAVLKVIDDHWEENAEKEYKNSDQFYMAEVFGLQAYSRLEKKQELMDEYRNIRYDDDERAVDDVGKLKRDAPKYNLDKKEYHVGIDHAGTLFQGLAFFKQWLSWQRADNSTTYDAATNTTYHDNYTLPEDVENSPPPFSALNPFHPQSNTSWSTIPLLHNTATEQTPTLFHMTAEKQYRSMWWDHLWFQPWAKELRLATISADAAADELPSGRRKIVAGRRWWNYEPEEASMIDLGGRGGVWSDNAEWISWRGACKEFERIYKTSEATAPLHPGLAAARNGTG